MSISASAELAPSSTSVAQRGRVRAIVSTVFLALAVLITPVIVTSVAVGVTLTDADRFTRTFAPVAHDPELQAVVSKTLGDAAVDAVAQHDPAGALERYLKESGASAAVQLSAKFLGASALQALETSAREHIDSYVASDNFARLWEGSLRTVHRTLTGAVTDENPSALLRLDADGTLWLNSTVVSQAAADFVADRAPTVADFIPTEDIADVRLAQDPVLAQVRAAARSAPLLITIPLVVGAVLLAVGVVLARRRLRALAWTLGVASAVLVAFGVIVGGLSLPAQTPQQAMISAFAAPVQALISGPAVIVALILAVATLAVSGGTFLMRNTTEPVDVAPHS